MRVQLVNERKNTPSPRSGLVIMLIAGLSILDAIPVFVAALVGFLVVQGFGLIKRDQLEKKEDQGPSHNE